MFKCLLNIGLYGKLINRLKHHYKNGYSCGKQIHSILGKAGKEWSFSTYLITNNPKIGGLCSSGHDYFYRSKHYPSFKDALVALTESVSQASQQLHEYEFFRSFTFGSKEDCIEYLKNYRKIQDRESWLENAVNFKQIPHQQQYTITEQFENSSWTAYITDEIEQLDIVENDIIVNYREEL